jgi:hypothetical protein
MAGAHGHVDHALARSEVSLDGGHEADPLSLGQRHGLIVARSRAGGASPTTAAPLPRIAA